MYILNEGIMIKISFSHTKSDSLWGRFGGGWNWKLGFQIGGNTLLISLLICEIRIDIIK
jgi:hypothetical protein